MEEIITLDGKQFKLTTDVPLTAEQKVQTIAEIRKQTGCGTCGQPRTAKMSNDWQYGGVRNLVDTDTGTGSSCTAVVKADGVGITMTSTPTQGVAPYSLEFRRSKANDPSTAITVANYVGTTDAILAARLGTGLTVGGPYPANPDVLTGSPQANPVTGVTENTTITRTYVMAIGDINDAVSRNPGFEGASLLFGTVIIDSCATPQKCVTYCKVFVACPVPVCDFTVA